MLCAFKATSNQANVCKRRARYYGGAHSIHSMAWRPLVVGTARHQRQRPTFGLLLYTLEEVSWCIVHTALPNQYAYERRHRFVSTGTHRAKGRSYLRRRGGEGGWPRWCWPFWPCRPGRALSTLEYTAAEGYTNALGGGENRITPPSPRIGV